MIGRELQQVRDSIDRLRVVFERHFGLRRATKILIYGDDKMGLVITAGAGALLVQLIPLPGNSVFDSPADLELTADDPNVVIAENAADSTGTTFNVSTPGSDTATSCNLDATGLAAGKQVSGTAILTILPAAPPPPPPPPPATSIGIIAAPPVEQAAKATATAAPGKLRAPAGK